MSPKAASREPQAKNDQHAKDGLWIPQEWNIEYYNTLSSHEKNLLAGTVIPEDIFEDFKLMTQQADLITKLEQPPVDDQLEKDRCSSEPTLLTGDEITVVPDVDPLHRSSLPIASGITLECIGTNAQRDKFSCGYRVISTIMGSEFDLRSTPSAINRLIVAGSDIPPTQSAIGGEHSETEGVDETNIMKIALHAVCLCGGLSGDLGVQVSLEISGQGGNIDNWPAIIRTAQDESATYQWGGVVGLTKADYVDFATRLYNAGLDRGEIRDLSGAGLRRSLLQERGIERVVEQLASLSQTRSAEAVAAHGHQQPLLSTENIEERWENYLLQEHDVIHWIRYQRDQPVSPNVRITVMGTVDHHPFPAVTEVLREIFSREVTRPEDFHFIVNDSNGQVIASPTSVAATGKMSPALRSSTGSHWTHLKMIVAVDRSVSFVYTDSMPTPDGISRDIEPEIRNLLIAAVNNARSPVETSSPVAEQVGALELEPPMDSPEDEETKSYSITSPLSPKSIESDKPWLHRLESDYVELGKRISLPEIQEDSITKSEALEEKPVLPTSILHSDRGASGLSELPLQGLLIAFQQRIDQEKTLKEAFDIAESKFADKEGKITSAIENSPIRRLVDAKVALAKEADDLLQRLQREFEERSHQDLTEKGISSLVMQGIQFNKHDRSIKKILPMYLTDVGGHSIGCFDLIRIAMERGDALCNPIYDAAEMVVQCLTHYIDELNTLPGTETHIVFNSDEWISWLCASGSEYAIPPTIDGLNDKQQRQIKRVYTAFLQAKTAIIDGNSALPPHHIMADQIATAIAQQKCTDDRACLHAERRAKENLIDSLQTKTEEFRTNEDVKHFHLLFANLIEANITKTATSKDFSEALSDIPNCLRTNFFTKYQVADLLIDEIANYISTKKKQAPTVGEKALWKEAIMDDEAGLPTISASLDLNENQKKHIKRAFTAFLEARSQLISVQPSSDKLQLFQDSCSVIKSSVDRLVESVCQNRGIGTACLRTPVMKEELTRLFNHGWLKPYQYKALTEERPRIVFEESWYKDGDTAHKLMELEKKIIALQDARKACEEGTVSQQEFNSLHEVMMTYVEDVTSADRESTSPVQASCSAYQSVRGGGHAGQSGQLATLIEERRDLSTARTKAKSEYELAKRKTKEIRQVALCLKELALAAVTIYINTTRSDRGALFSFHGRAGLERATRAYNTLFSASSPDAIVQALIGTFSGLSAFNTGSFSAYLLDVLEDLLHSSSLDLSNVTTKHNNFMPGGSTRKLSIFSSSVTIDDIENNSEEASGQVKSSSLKIGKTKLSEVVRNNIWGLKTTGYTNNLNRRNNVIVALNNLNAPGA